MKIGRIPLFNSALKWNVLPPWTMLGHHLNAMFPSIKHTERRDQGELWLQDRQRGTGGLGSWATRCGFVSAVSGSKNCTDVGHSYRQTRVHLSRTVQKVPSGLLIGDIFCSALLEREFWEQCNSDLRCDSAPEIHWSSISKSEQFYLDLCKFMA